MKQITPRGLFAAYSVIFAIGFFGLAAQTLLFRDFFAVFEGHELGIALFFSSWLLWVALGALLGRRRSRALDALDKYFEFLALLYFPAYVLQEWLIGNARALADVKPYELFPLAKMIPVALLANAPVSLCCGWLFTRACQWLFRLQQTLPVARVYILEALGSFAGGVLVTLLLARGVSAENAGLAAALLPALALFFYRACAKAYITASLPLLIILAAQLAGFPNFLERARNLRAWQRLMPQESYRGSFTTPQARYLWGEYHGQINVMAWQSVLDSIPNTEHASEVIALHLAQNPQARKFLVVGSGSFSICQRLLALPQAEAITWLDPDPDYPRRLLSVLPESFRAGVERLEIPAGDIRGQLSSGSRQYDLVMLNLPAVRTLALNRYFTREFFLLLKGHLAEDGVLGVRVTAGENYMGDELVNAGASVFHTLSSVFTNLTLKPGEESWLLASDGSLLSAAPAVLRDRFRAIVGAERIYPAEGLLSLYLPDRISYQLDYYRNAVSKAPLGLLLNTDQQPKALLHSLLFAAREAGTTLSLNFAVRSLAISGALLMPLAVLLYGLLRRVYVIKGLERARASDSEGAAASPGAARFDDYFLVFSTGAVSMGLSIVLMFRYQSVHGSLFLQVGLVSALFMLGLALGSLAAQKIVARSEGRFATRLHRYAKHCGQAGLVPLGLLLSALLILAVHLLPLELSPNAFRVLFLCAGVSGGLFVPAVAARWSAAGRAPAVSGALIELNDHLGGAGGGLLIGLILLPVFGNAYALALLALLLLVNLTAWPWGQRGFFSTAGLSAIAQRATAERFQRVTRAAGYVMFGLGVFAVASALIFRLGERDLRLRSFQAAAEAMSGALEHKKQSRSLKDDQTLDFFSLGATGETSRAYIFSSEKLARDAGGYGGEIILAVKTSAEGQLEDFRIIESNETPSYLAALSAWFQRLLGKKLFERTALAEVDAVSGATLTSVAITRILRQSGQTFAREVLLLDIGEAEKEISSKLPNKRFLVFSALAVLALALRARPLPWARQVFLLLVAGALGIGLNVQYSLAHVFSLLGLKLPALGGNEAFLLVVILPVVILLFGNIFCGYLCPFGALQELIGGTRPRALQSDPDKLIWRYGRFTKFVMLFLFSLWFATSLSPELASHDPLTTVFSKCLTPLVAAFVAAGLGLSFFFNRFWCRNLCPAGAFLALLNGVQLLKPLIPKVNHLSCVFGVTAGNELDCICCDRCRFPPDTRQQSAAATCSRPTPLGREETTLNTYVESWDGGGWRNAVFLIAVLVMAVLFIQQGARTWAEERAQLALARSGIVTGGSPRHVDIRRIKYLIEQRALSDHEAVYYKTVGRSPPGR